MADNSKEKIISVNTTGATKNVKTLKQQIKELRDQLGTLEKGTAEYDAIAKQLADTNQRQIEINEAMKYSNQDVGQTFSNLTRVATGVIGAINGVNAVMTMMGADGEEAAEALKKIQLTMAVIQGMNAMVEATKSLHGLGVAFGLVGDKAKTSERQLQESVNGTTGAVTRETTTINANTKAKTTNAGATKSMSAAEKGAAASGTKLSGVMGLLGGGIKKVATAIKSFMVSNPFTALLAAGAAVVAVFAKIKNAAKEAEKNTKAVGKALSDVKAAEWDALLNGGVTALAKARAGINQEFKSIYDDATSWTNQTVNTVIAGIQRGAKQGEESVEFISNVMTKRREKANEENAKSLENYTKWLATMEDKESQSYKNMMEGQKNAQLKFHTVNIAFYDQELKALDAMLNASGDQINAETRQIIADRRKEIYNLRNEEAKAYNSVTVSYNEYLKSIKKETTNTNTVKKSIKELIELFKELRKELLNTSLSFKGLKNAFGSIYSETDQMMDKVENIIKTHELDKVLSEEFKHALNEDRGILNDLSRYEVTLDFIFDKEALNKLETDLIEAEKELNKKYQEYQEKKTKPTEKAYEAQKRITDELKRQVTVYNELTVAVQKYVQANNAENEKKGEKAHQKRVEQLEKEKEIYLSYWTDILANNPWAELNDTLLTTTTTLEDIKIELGEISDEEISIGLSDEDAERMRELKKTKDELADRDISMIERMKEWRELSKEINEIESRRVLNQDAKDRLDEIFDRRQELEIQQTELERTLARTEHEIRLKEIEDEYEARKKDTEAEVQNLHNSRSARGGGAEDYNTEVDALNIELQAIKDQAQYIEDYYQRVMATVEEGSEQWVQLEIEKQAALTQLEEDGAKKRAEITQAEVDRKKKIQQTYMNALSSITGQISSLLGEKMNAYDADSKEYKDLQIKQATINTLSGMLSAFVSGFQSGIPWPGNLILAGVLSGLVYATGRQSIENIQNESLRNTNSSSAASGNFGEYDTLTYMNNVDLLDSIQDQRVYVTENDITSTQNRVRVRESEATF